MGVIGSIQTAFNSLLGIADAFGSVPDFIRTIGGDGNRFRPIAYRDIERLISKYTWRQLLSRGRYIYANSGMVAGAINDKANYVIGRNWRFVYHGPNKEWGEQAEQTINEWGSICDSRGQPYDLLTDLWVGCTALDKEGDFFVLLTQNSKGYPIVQIIAAHRIGTRQLPTIYTITEGKYEGFLMINGCIYNKNMRPVAYRYMADSPLDDEDIPIQNLVPFYDPMWFGQGRGLPCITAALADFDDIFEIREAEKMAVEMGSSTAILEYNETGRVQGSEDFIQRAVRVNPATDAAQKNTTKDFFYQMIDKGQVRYFKANAGHKLEMFRPDRPGASFMPFADHILRGAFMGMGWPIEWCYNPEKLGGPAGRIIVDRINRTIRHRQGVMTPGAKRIALWAISRHMKLGLLPEVDDWYQWDIAYPAEASIDNNYDSANERAGYLLGMDNLSQIYGRRGRNWKKAITQKMDELEFVHAEADKRGLALGEVIQFTPNMQTDVENVAGSAKEPTDTSDKADKEKNQ
jgi:hypothetical protein